MIYFRREVISCALISSYPLFLSQLRDHNSLDKLSKLIPMYISSHSHHNFPPSFFISKKNNGIKYIQSTDKRERKRRNRNYICARPSSSSTKTSSLYCNTRYYIVDGEFWLFLLNKLIHICSQSVIFIVIHHIQQNLEIPFVYRSKHWSFRSNRSFV